MEAELKAHAKNAIFEREFMSSVTPAHATFRVAVEGRDASGFWYQRVYPYLFELKP